MHTHTLAELSLLLSTKKISSLELTRHFLERCAHYQHLNAYSLVTAESALTEARAADEARQQNRTPLNALLGIPLAQKDIFCTQGHRTAVGSKMLSNFIPPYDATVIANFKQAGCPMLGKTNCDEFAMGSSNETSYDGPVLNPWATDCTPGGSSGGSAAAVAARLAPAASGTDTGGSIRQPAAMCGLVGLKPTYGLVSRYGMIAFASSMDQGGPMTQTAEDAAMMLNVMAGFDEKDATSVQQPKVDYTKTLNDSIQGLRIGLPKEFFTNDLNDDMHRALDEAIAVLKKQGATFHEISLPHVSLSVPVYYILAPAECSSNLARYDGIRFGYQCSDARDLFDLYTRSRSEGFGAEVKRRVLVGTYVLSSGFYDAYYVKAQKVRTLIAQDFHKNFKDIDMILCPTTPTPAFKLGAKSKDPVAMYLSDIYTIAVNLAGLPGVQVPIGLLDNKPIGMQLIGNFFSEARLLNVAHRYQQETQWHRHMPTNFEPTNGGAK
ncbi:MAG: Asp-tRNA(Asn)/Glu-tRNA(Gln) amidotransferase subunit GatA [Pseudomonadota bacterium]